MGFAALYPSCGAVRRSGIDGYQMETVGIEV